MIACQDDQAYNASDNEPLMLQWHVMNTRIETKPPEDGVYLPSQLRSRSTLRQGSLVFSEHTHFHLRLRQNQLRRLESLSKSRSSTTFGGIPGYSPPAPKPAMPRPTIIIQNKLSNDDCQPLHRVSLRFQASFEDAHPSSDLPWAAVASMIPRMRKQVANTMPVRRPNLSMINPNVSMPKISPMRYELDRRVLMVEEILLG